MVDKEAQKKLDEQLKDTHKFIMKRLLAPILVTCSIMLISVFINIYFTNSDEKLSTMLVFQATLLVNMLTIATIVIAAVCIKNSNLR